VPEVRQGEDTILKATPERGNVFPVDADVVAWGTSFTRYTMEPLVLHETVVTEPTATIIKKTALTQAQGNPLKPRVMVRQDQDPDNDFNRHAYDDDLLWRIVERVLKRRNR
jgi:hypothetical protein